VDVNAKNPEGKTALDFAKMRGATPIVDMLVKANAKAGATTIYSPPDPKPATSLRAALERSIPLLQKTDSIFMQKAGCVSCHNNTLTAVTVSTARRNGVRVDEQIARGQVKKIAPYIESWRERALQGIGIPGESATVAWILLGLAAENYPPDTATDALARYLQSQQHLDGRWRVFAHRPLIESSDIAATSISLRSLQTYGPKAQRAKYDMAIRRAADWLMKAQPQTTQDRAFQLLGLEWEGVKADSYIIKISMRELVAEQRADGGWGRYPRWRATLMQQDRRWWH
jgi:hypothetical protein